MTTDIDLNDAGLIPVSSPRVRGLLRAAQIEISTKNGKDYAPSWAVKMCEVEGISERLRMVAIRRLQRDPESKAWVSALIGCVGSEKGRAEIVESVGREVSRIIMCKCGRRFEVATEWRNHLEDECPLRSSLTQPTPSTETQPPAEKTESSS